MKIKKICCCGIEFYGYKERIYCSRLCASKNLKYSKIGKSRSIETKEKIRKKLIGKKLTEIHKQNIGKSSLGRFWKQESKLKMSKLRIGSKNPMYGRKGTDESKEKRKKTNLLKHGSEYPFRNYSGYSKISQKLFWQIFEKLSEYLKKKTYFYELNKEFSISYQNQFYRYDFVNTILKKCIEFHGNKFHPKANLLDEEINWCAFNPNKTAFEARKLEDKKNYGLRSRGYEILIIWEDEYRKDEINTIKNCINFLTYIDNKESSPDIIFESIKPIKTYQNY